MTLDEAIKHCEEVSKELEEEAIKGCCDDTEIMNKCTECAEEHRQLAKWLRELKELREQIRWIPCSEMLPDTDDMVLCWYKYYHWSQDKVLPEYGLGYYLRNIPAWCGEVANGKDVEVIAWMPLPEVYQGGENE